MDPYSPGPGLASSSASAGSPDDQATGLDSLVAEDNSPTTLASSANSEARAPQSTVSAACLACRNKHLKCDGKTPCGRCVITESGCVYIPSRRGYKPRRAPGSNPNKRHASSSPDATGDSCPMLLGAGTASSIAPFDPAVTLPEGSPFVASQNLAGLQLYRPYGGGRDSVNLVLSSSTGGTIPSQVPMPSLDERCLDSFYHNFHAAHPFVLPKEYLLRIAKDLNTRHLFAAIRYIGSLYLGGVGPARANYFDEAIRLSSEPGCPKDGFLVQTLLLLIVGLDGSCQQDRARQILGDAERIAISIGLNTRDFATVHGQSIPVWEESWRRTWWDLYVVSGMVAGVHRHTNFLLFDYESSAALPCEEHLYLSGSIPQPMYLEDLEDRDLSGDEREFSSFAYRILAARNLGKFMRSPHMYGPDDENLHRIEALLTNWRMYLPISKRDALNKDCQLDEMMFQAHMITHAVSIMLHQPHSQLDSSPARSVTSCAPHRPVASGESFNTHTQHTFSSASEISKMITHRAPLLSHSHFFTCVVTLSSIVHLSIWSQFFVPLNEDDLRQLIRLNIGALNKLSEVWKAANTASGQVKGVAQEIYRAKKAQQANPAYWVGMTQEEMINSIAADETIMSEIETLQTMPNLLPG